MKAIILSAGQGKRLLPLTQDTPKCLLPVKDGMSLLGWQLSELARAGIEDAVVVSGFRFERIREDIRKYQSLIQVRELYNPFFKLADNLGSVWVARDEMRDDFLLLNGDTLFTADVARSLLNAQHSDVTLTVSRKNEYDSDDMKVSTDANLLKAVGKKLDLEIVNGESIGMMKFTGQGVQSFKENVNYVMESEKGLKTWYLSVLDEMARKRDVGVIEVSQNQWCEVDYPVDYKHACEKVRIWSGEDRGEVQDDSVASSCSNQSAAC